MKNRKAVIARAMDRSMKTHGKKMPMMGVGQRKMASQMPRTFPIGKMPMDEQETLGSVSSALKRRRRGR